MSIKDLKLLQKIKEFNQKSQGAIGTQSYSNVDLNLLQRATEDPQKNKIIYDYDDDNNNNITPDDVDKFDYDYVDDYIEGNFTVNNIVEVINKLISEGKFSNDEANKFKKNMKYNTKKDLLKLFNNWLIKHNNEVLNYNNSQINHTLKNISNVGSYSKLRFDGETDSQYIQRMKSLALNQPSTDQIKEQRKVKERNMLRNNLLEIGDIKQVELIMNDSRLDNSEIINKINSIWKKIINDIKENYVKIDAKTFVDFALESMYKVETKNEGKLNDRELKYADIKKIDGINFVLTKNTLYDYDENYKISAIMFKNDVKYSRFNQKFKNITEFKEFISNLNQVDNDTLTQKKIKATDNDDTLTETPISKKTRSKTKGKGFLVMSNKRIVKGKGLMNPIKLNSTKGIKQVEQNDFVEFGKFVLNFSKLESNRLRILYKNTFLNIKEIPTKIISDTFKDLLLELIEMNKFNERLFNTLDTKEQKLCVLLLDKSNVKKILKIKLNNSVDEYSIKKDRLEVIIGEINAGNDNQLLKDELKTILIWLKDNKYITTQVFNKSFEEIN
jgi:hypothetical protein